MSKEEDNKKEHNPWSVGSNTKGYIYCWWCGATVREDEPCSRKYKNND